MQTPAFSHWLLGVEKVEFGHFQQWPDWGWNLTNQRHTEGRGWTKARGTRGRASGRGAHWTNGGNAWVWRLVQMCSCVEREGWGSPLSRQCSHWAGGANSEEAVAEGSVLLVWTSEQAESVAAALAAVGRRREGAVRSEGLGAWVRSG